MILELLVEEVSKLGFAEFVTRTLLHPIGMDRSNYDFLGSQINASASFNFDGSLSPTYKYASAAATGFVSSASDLSKLVLELLHGKNSPLEVETLKIDARTTWVFAWIWNLGARYHSLCESFSWGLRIRA